FAYYAPHRDLHSFPTRRSSDLRRCCSAVTAASGWLSSWSLRCLIAAGRSPGRICREDAAEFSMGGVVGAGVGAACSRDGSVEKRSEEHTSELQSRSDLVCRLLL